MERNANKLAWGIITAGRIARKFAAGVAHSRSGELAAVASLTPGKGEEYAREFGVPRVHHDYQALIEDPAVEAVYVATPHPWHARWAIAAARAGKHVLCEKPLAMNLPQAEAVVAAAREHDVFLMEAFMYRCHPQTRRLVELLRAGAVGRVRQVRATFGYRGSHTLESVKLNRALGGGAILDVGCYTMSICRLVAGVALGGEFAEPEELCGMAVFGPESTVDEYAVADLRFPGGILAQLSTGVRLAQDNRVEIFGEEGRLEVPAPWFCSGIEGGVGRLLVHRPGNERPEVVEVSTPEWLYGIEADTVAEHLESRQAPAPSMSWQDSLGNIRALDRWRRAVGLEYDSDREPTAGLA